MVVRPGAVGEEPLPSPRPSRTTFRAISAGPALGQNLVGFSANSRTRWVSKEELFHQADILTIHLVFSSRRKGLVGKYELGLMKSSARLVNTSRGPIVDEVDLVEALRQQHIAGAAMDVFDVEPLPQEHALRHLDNVIATSHIGYVSRDLYRVFYQDTVANIANWLQTKSR